MRQQLIVKSILLSSQKNWDYKIEKLVNDRYVDYLFMEEDDFNNYYDLVTSYKETYQVMDRNDNVQFRIEKGNLWTI